MQRIGLVVHPARDIDRALDTLREWAEQHGRELVQVPTRKTVRQVAPLGEVDACDLVVAVGGDGTVLTALRAAAPNSVPVLGVACGSLGALSAVRADGLGEALGRVDSGDWSSRTLPALEAEVDGRRVAWALNDFVLTRRAGQLVVDVAVGGELYARIAGDGVIVATPVGSSAYSMAADGPIVVSGTEAFVVTPLLMHGGSAPPVVVRSDLEVTLDAHPGYSGFDIEVDGHIEIVDGTRFTLKLTDSTATLVVLGEPELGLAALRRRGLIADSPRVLARDQRSVVPRRDEARPELAGAEPQTDPVHGS
jgi:NAD+ kinase